MSFSLTLDVPDIEADDIAALLLEAGAAGAEVRDGSIAPMPGAPRPGQGRAHVVAFFTSRRDAERAAAIVGRSGSVAEVVEEDWSESWKKELAPFTIGRVFIRPSWIEAPPPPGTVEVVLDPGMAFGTGTHPTTALCLAAMDRLLADPRTAKANVLDVGTGSGLLAIAAAKLGAARVVGTDVDPVALRVAGENARRNGVAPELEPPEAVSGSFRVVVANILANTLVDLAPELAARLEPGGTLLLSGILAGQEEEVRAAYVARGLSPERALDASDGDWRLVALRSPGAPGLPSDPDGTAS